MDGATARVAGVEGDLRLAILSRDQNPKATGGISG